MPEVADPVPPCEDRWVFDGRQCEEPLGHDGLHANGLVMWGEYKRGSGLTPNAGPCAPTPVA